MIDRSDFWINQASFILKIWSTPINQINQKKENFWKVILEIIHEVKKNVLGKGFISAVDRDIGPKLYSIFKCKVYL